MRSCSTGLIPQPDDSDRSCAGTLSVLETLQTSTHILSIQLVQNIEPTNGHRATSERQDVSILYLACIRVGVYAFQFCVYYTVYT